MRGGVLTMPTMSIFRIRITMADRSVGCYTYTGLFASAREAIDQTCADFPEACSVSAMCVRKGFA